MHSRDIINGTPAYHIDEGIALSLDSKVNTELEVYPNPTS